MSVILLVLGVALAAAGGALIGIGIPIRDLGLGATTILAGTFVLVGGLLLVGLSAVVSELARVAAALKSSQSQAVLQPVARLVPPGPPTEAVAREPARDVARDIELPPPRVAAAMTGPSVEASAIAIERLHSSMSHPDKVVPEPQDAIPLSPNGQHAAHHVEPPAQAESAPRSAGAAAVETREPRLDFLFRPRKARQPSQQEAFDSLWPRRRAPEEQEEPRLDVARAPVAADAPAAVAAAAPAPVTAAGPALVATDASAPVSEAAPDPSPPPPPASQERTVAILKSGVVDGMAYTLYADGSIEAQLPQGTVRFGSIAELRAHIENSA